VSQAESVLQPPVGAGSGGGLPHGAHHVSTLEMQMGIHHPHGMPREVGSPASSAPSCCSCRASTLVRVVVIMSLLRCCGHHVLARLAHAQKPMLGAALMVTMVCVCV